MTFIEKPQYIVTTAMFYANGPFHLGHVLEMIQADIWVRAQRLQGKTCWFFSGDDVHGTPIMLKAEQQGVTADALVAQVHEWHQADIAGYSISYDHFGSTRCSQNQLLVNECYQRLLQANALLTQDIRQAYDEKQAMFLPDRYVKGTCPRCHAPDQYADHCEKCGATYDMQDLLQPRSTLTATQPSMRDTEHLFLDLAPQQAWLKTYWSEAEIAPPVVRKLTEWVEDLRPWDITRDAPYFGFAIPDRPQQFFYVWLDAPLGYMASMQSWLDQQMPGLSAWQFWDDPEVKTIHYIGKDIINFHGLFWPVLLQQTGHRAPQSLRTHGFMTINAEKMSKSRGTFILAKTFREVLPAECLRYYLAGKLSEGLADMDFNFQDFKNRINAELVGKIINLGSRCYGILNKHFAGQLLELPAGSLFEQLLAMRERVYHHWHASDNHQAMREVLNMADAANQYIDQQKPWVLLKSPSSHAQAQQVVTEGLNAFLLLMHALAPVLPTMWQRLMAVLLWPDHKQPLPLQTVVDYPRLLERISDEKLNEFVKRCQDEKTT